MRFDISDVWTEFSSHPPGCEVVGLKAPLLTVGFIIQQVLFHDLVFGFKQEVAVRTGHGAAALVHWSERKQQMHR